MSAGAWLTPSGQPHRYPKRAKRARREGFAAFVEEYEAGGREKFDEIIGDIESGTDFWRVCFEAGVDPGLMREWLEAEESRRVVYEQACKVGKQKCVWALKERARDWTNADLAEAFDPETGDYRKLREMPEALRAAIQELHTERVDIEAVVDAASGEIVEPARTEVRVTKIRLVDKARAGDLLGIWEGMRKPEAVEAGETMATALMAEITKARGRALPEGGE